MSIEVMSVVLHHSKAQGTTKLVLMGIANHQGDGGAWPAISTLAKYAGGVSRRTVQRSLADLVKTGELETTLQAGGSYGDQPNGKPNLYRVLVSCPPECDGSPNHRRKRDLLEGGDADVTGDIHDAGGRRTRHGGDDIHVAGGMTPTSPEPSIEPSIEPSLNREDVKIAWTEFWEVYPRKAGVADAKKAFVKQFTKYGHEVVEGARRFAQDPNLPVEKQYIPHPSTWLNQERWNDEPLPERKLTPEQVAERNRQLNAIRRDKDREATARLFAEMAEANAKATPPPPCPHGSTLVRCQTCLKKIKDQTTEGN